MNQPPPLPTDPTNRAELADWLRRRERLRPGEPLDPREYLMVQRLQAARPPYSLT